MRSVVSVSMPPALAEQLRAEATQLGRTFSAHVVDLLESRATAGEMRANFGSVEHLQTEPVGVAEQVNAARVRVGSPKRVKAPIAGSSPASHIEEPADEAPDLMAALEASLPTAESRPADSDPDDLTARVYGHLQPTTVTPAASIAAAEKIERAVVLEIIDRLIAEGELIGHMERGGERFYWVIAEE